MEMKNENVLDCLSDLLAILTNFYWNNFLATLSKLSTVHSMQNNKL